MHGLAFEALVPYGWNDRVLALYSTLSQSADDAACVPARIVRVERSACVAVGAWPDVPGERLLRARVLPAVGDWVLADPASATVRDVLPRWSAITRIDPDGDGVQTLAADIDIVAVTAPADRLSPARVEREVTVAWDSGAVPLVVVTKADLDTGGVAGELAGRLQGVDVVSVSAATGAGVTTLRERLMPDRTAVLLGPSGAGKSTLANALVGAERLATGAVRAGDARGRHTTTSRQLLAVPGGGSLIDTPGLRSLGLAADGSAVTAGFPDVEAAAAGCRFSDCTHDGEPGCAVTAAIDAGALDPERLDSFRKLAREAEALRRRHDPLAARELRRVHAIRTRQARAKRHGR